MKSYSLVVSVLISAAAILFASVSDGRDTRTCDCQIYVLGVANAQAALSDAQGVPASDQAAITLASNALDTATAALDEASSMKATLLGSSPETQHQEFDLETGELAVATSMLANAVSPAGPLQTTVNQAQSAYNSAVDHASIAGKGYAARLQNFDTQLKALKDCIKRNGG